METKEIINEEVTELLESQPEIEYFGKGFMKGVCVGTITAVCGLMIYRFAVRPIIAKIKSKKECVLVEASEEVTCEESDNNDSGE